MPKLPRKLQLGYCCSAAGAIRKKFGSTERFFLGDIKDKAALKQALNGCQALIILTSAVSRMVAPPFDLISKPVEDPSAAVTKDFATLFAQTLPGL
jgi:hypothetical protein